MNNRPTFAIFGNTFQARKSTPAPDVLAALRAHGARVIMDRPFHEFLTTRLGLGIETDGVFDGDRFEADYAVSIGGDGTFLKAATRVAGKLTPLLGVNAGRLGFLAGVRPREIGDAFDDLFAGRYTIEEHTAIAAKAGGRPLGDCPYALNDIAVLKRDVASMISIRAAVGGRYVATYQADGLIVCTPTGSTAYSLSNGGPIIVPQTGTLCITPVAPHSLNIRPIVISDDSVVTLTVTSRSHNFLAAIDGRSETVAEGVDITISRAPFTTRIIKREGQDYFASLREKMMWGADRRKR